MLSGTLLRAPTDELHACLDRLGSVDPGDLSDAEQAELLRELTRAESRVSALKLTLLAAAEQAHTARRAGAASTGQWAATLSRSDGGQTQRQVDLAGQLQQRTATQQALADGQISPPTRRSSAGPTASSPRPSPPTNGRPSRPRSWPRRRP